MLRVETELSIDEFEEDLRTIASGEPALSLPNRLSASAVGSLASLIQLIITWARKHPDTSSLRLHAATADSPALRNFAKTAWGLAALNMARNVQLVSGQPIDRREALLNSLDFVAAMHRGSLEQLRDLNKTVLPLICIDNASELRRPKRLYDQATGKVLDRRSFQDLATACFRALRPHEDLYASLETMEAVASLLHEAFQNTDEHAQTDFLGNRYRRSIRGILFSYQYVQRTKLGAMAGESEPLRQYFENWRPDRANAQHGQFLEMSIFDSGSGLAQNWLGKRGQIGASIADGGFPIASEYQAVLSCLRKGGTTKMHDTRGNGLYRIMQVVKRLGGFIRIRTGRLSLVKAFDLEPNARAADDDIRMLDMRTGNVPDRQRAWADGTVITVILPLNRGFE